MSKILSDIAEYVTDKVDCSSLTSETYIGMDNLIPNKGGRTISEYVPEDGTTTAYKKGDILLGNIRPYFKKIWLAENDGGCSPDVLCIRAKNGISSLFLYAVLAQDSFFDYDVKGAKGSKMPRGDKDHIMAFPVPELDKKDEIGKLIDGIYKIIQNNTSICFELEAMAKLLYDYWFVQFDFPDENGKPYKSSGGKMVWNEELKREIPYGWETGCIGDILFALECGDRPSGGAEKSGIPSIGAENIIGIGKYDYSAEKYVSEDYYNHMTSGVVKSWDVLVYKDGAGVGQASMFGDGFPYEKCAINSHVFILRSVDNEYQDYLYLTLCQSYIKKTLAVLAMKAAQPGLNQPDIKSVKIVIPEKTVLKTFNLKIDALFHKIFACANESCQLASLRDFLLPMLMNGQVKVKKGL